MLSPSASISDLLAAVQALTRTVQLQGQQINAIAHHLGVTSAGSSISSARRLDLHQPHALANPSSMANAATAQTLTDVSAALTPAAASYHSPSPFASELGMELRGGAQLTPDVRRLLAENEQLREDASRLRHALKRAKTKKPAHPAVPAVLSTATSTTHLAAQAEPDAAASTTQSVSEASHAQL
jgi:hypothetical protein